MAIYRLITNGSFGPDEIKVMTAAYEAALRAGALLTRITNAHELASKMHDRMPVLPQTGVRAIHYPKIISSQCFNSKRVDSHCGNQIRIAGIDVRGCRLLHITEKAAPHNTLKRRAESEKPEKTRLATSLV